MLPLVYMVLMAVAVSHCSAVMSDVVHMVNDIPDWDYMVFSQQWPETVCIDANATHEHTCSIPVNVTSWTVHGIWPTKSGTTGPSFCDRGKKFDPSQIQSIEAVLMAKWPNLYTDEPLYQFWTHEYEKHGTCASSMTSMDSEYKYFSTGLKMHETFNFHNFLANHNIVPKDFHTYPYAEFLSAMKSSIGADLKLQCVYDKVSATQYITQIEMCVDKQFKAVSCGYKNNESPWLYLGSNVRHQGAAQYQGPQPCYDTQPIAYPAIKHPY